jgi:fengycin family lipopeptide synthetase C
VGGEALSPPHVSRVRRAWPRLVITNGYGPTENTTFSTTFRVEREYDASIPIGRPITHSTAYVLDSELRLLPAGAVGEICVGGAGLARGYLGDDALTAARFVPHPFAAGERLYRTGDLGRWLPDGNLEYVGRADDQLKVRGHRIEPGEIEHALSCHPDVKSAVVAAREGQAGDKTLVGFFTAVRGLPAAAIREWLAERLPAHLVPARLVQLDELPLLPSGKVDRHRLTASAVEDDHVAHVVSTTEAEEKLCAVFAELLQRDPIGIHDHFFHLGGDSIKAIQVVSRARALGLKLEVRDIYRHPTIAQLARNVRAVERRAAEEPYAGAVPLTPIQRRFFAEQRAGRSHFNQSVVFECKLGFERVKVEEALRLLLVHHDALRMRFGLDSDPPSQSNAGLDAAVIAVREHDYRDDDAWQERYPEDSTRVQASLDLERGPLVGAGLFRTREGDHLVVAIHHLVVDGVSWRILIEDFVAVYRALVAGEAPRLPERTAAFGRWAQALTAFATGPAFAEHAAYWRAFRAEGAAALPRRALPSRPLVRDTRSEVVELGEAETARLLTVAPRAYNTAAHELLIAALALALREFTSGTRILLDLEGHGREAIAEDVDVSRTVGWFTTIYPVLIEADGADLGAVVKRTKETLRRIPGHGIGHGLLRGTDRRAEVVFNYLGQFERPRDDGARGAVTLSRLATGELFGPDVVREHAIGVTGSVAGGRLAFVIDYHPEELARDGVRELAAAYARNLRAVIDHCAARSGSEATPSDYADRDLTAAELDDIRDLLGSSRTADSERGSA